MTMVTHKYYDIYMTYPLRASWCLGPCAVSSVRKKALHWLPNLVDGPPDCGLVIQLG
jgi:hypothetical protein